MAEKGGVFLKNFRKTPPFSAIFPARDFLFSPFFVILPSFFFHFFKIGGSPKNGNFPPFFRDVSSVLLTFYKKWPKRKGRPKIGVLDLNSSETESATMGVHCEPAATRGTVRPRRPCSALGTTRKTLLLAATPSLGRKLPASARIPTTP